MVEAWYLREREREASISGMQRCLYDDFRKKTIPSAMHMDFDFMESVNLAVRCLVDKQYLRAGVVATMRNMQKCSPLRVAITSAVTVNTILWRALSNGLKTNYMEFIYLTCHARASSQLVIPRLSLHDRAVVP